MTLREGLDGMKEGEPLYLRFNHEVVYSNPEFNDELKKIVEPFESVLNYDWSRRVCFMGMGDEQRTLQHVAGIDNYFVQLSGTKRWRLLAPGSTPYMRPKFGRGGGNYISGWVYVWDNDPPLPYVDVITEAGDFLYFPPFWWHEVHNIGADAFQFGCGVRPFGQQPKNLLSMLIPPIVGPPGAFGPRSAVMPRILQVVYRKIFKGLSHTDYFYKKSGGVGSHGQVDDEKEEEKNKKRFINTFL